MFIRLLLYENLSRLIIAVDLSRQKEFNVDPKAIQQIEFVGQLKKLSNDNNDNFESMLILTFL